MAKSNFKPSFYVDVYEYARSGMSVKSIAKALGVASATLNGWFAAKPSLKQALERGREACSSNSSSDFQDYVYKRLPEELQELWTQIEACDKEPNGIKRIEALLEKKGQRARQSLFVHAFISYNFNASKALRAVNISRKTFESWCTMEPDFQRLMTEVQEYKKDFVESALFKSIRRGETPAIIFANKTLNRDRGYGEKIQVQMDGQVQHNVTVVSVADLGLTLDEQKRMLDAIRINRGKQDALEANYEIRNSTQAG